jgi:hypothetical protein
MTTTIERDIVVKRDFRAIRDEVVERYSELSVNGIKVTGPELKTAQTASELHTALRALYWRCSAEIPFLMGMLGYMRELRTTV